jgi:hypothetical protein
MDLVTSMKLVGREGAVLLRRCRRYRLELKVYNRKARGRVRIEE